MKAPGLAIAALLLASAAPLQTSPAPVRGLPQGWTMIDDARYAPADTRWRYQPPRARRGIYAHGASGELPQAPEAHEQAMQCYRRNGNFHRSGNRSNARYGNSTAKAFLFSV